METPPDGTTPDGTTPPTFKTSLAAWFRTTAPVAARSTAVSFVIGLVVAALLVVVHSIGGPSSELTLGLPGFRLHTGIDQGAYALPLLIAALTAWAVLTSLSRLVVARQVRGHLRDLPMHRARAGGREEPDHDGDAMVERLMLEAYLSIASSTARAIAMTCALAVILPVAAAVGVAACWAACVLVARRRFMDGRDVSHQLATANKGARFEPGATSHDRLVDAIYLRDTRIHRLTIPQAGVLLAAVLGLVVVPAWLARPSGGAATTVLVVLMWLQALQAAVTESGALGWRAELWYERQIRRFFGLGRTDGPVAPDRAGLLWWSAPNSTVTFVAVLGRRPPSGSDLVEPLASAAAGLGESLVILTRGHLRRAPAVLGQGLGFDRRVVVLGLAGPGAGAPLAQRVLDCGGLVVRRVATDPVGSGPVSDDVVCVDVPLVRTLADGALLTEALHVWADASISTTEAQQRTEALAGEAAATLAAREDVDDSLGFEA